MNEVLEKITPKLAEALQGPLQGQAMTLLLKRLKVSTPEEAAKQLQSNPKAIPAAKKAEDDYVKLVEPNVTVEKEWRKQTPQLWLMIIFNIGYFIMLGLFVFASFSGGLALDEWVKGIVGTLIGVLTGQLNRINDYWVSSSSGSAQKTDMLSQSVQKKG